MVEPWRTDGSDACIDVRVNGKGEKVNKGTISDLASFIQGKAAGAGISKFSVYVDGDEVEADDIDRYNVNEIHNIDIKTYDIVRAVECC